jgi:hypothetical protein
MPRIVQALLVAPTLVLAHQLVFLARYGSIYGEALAHGGHGQAWSDAVATVAVGSLILFLAALAGLVRLRSELARRQDVVADGRLGAGRPLAAEPRVHAVIGRFVALAARLTALTLVALTIQENVEHVAAGLDAPGIGVLVSRDYPFAVGIVLAVGIAVAAVATLLTWRRAVLVARLRALSARGLARRRVASTWRPAARPPRPRPGLVARQLGRRAPPALLAA